MRLISRLLAPSLLLLALPVSAAQVAGLYEVHQPVTSQAEAERTQAMTAALQSLAVRLTGNPASAQDPRLKPLLADPQRLVQQYVYEAGEPLTLAVTFVPSLTTSAMAKAGLALWNPDRPQLLAWWFNDTDGSGLIADAGDDAAHAGELRAAAQNSGLPLALPMGDLSEQMLNAGNLLGNDPALLAGLSERYSVDARLAVVERASAEQRKADWVLWVGDNAERGSVTAADSRALATAVLQAVASKLASRFVATGNAEPLLLDVEGASLERYAELQRLLAPFSPQLVAVQGQKLRFRVRASADQLRAQLGLGHLRELPAAAAPAPAQPATVQPILPQPAATTADSVPRTLHFSW